MIRACDKVMSTLATKLDDKEKLLFVEGAMRELKAAGRVFPLPSNDLNEGSNE